MRLTIEQHIAGDTLYDLIHTIALGTVSLEHWSTRTYLMRLANHARQIDIHMRRKVDFINDQQVASEDAQTTLSRDVVTTCHINHKNPIVD
jgi:hypothetical protein